MLQWDSTLTLELVGEDTNKGRMVWCITPIVGVLTNDYIDPLFFNLLRNCFPDNSLVLFFPCYNGTVILTLELVGEDTKKGKNFENFIPSSGLIKIIVIEFSFSPDTNNQE